MKESKKNIKVPAHGPHKGVGDKAKDFKGSIKRLFKELKSFRVVIYIALVLAALGSILSIMTPNKSSDLTDEIAKGLVINTKSMKTLTKEITSNMTEEKFGSRIQGILNMNIGPDAMQQVLTSPNISVEEKTKFTNLMQELATSKDSYLKLTEFSSELQEIILPTSTYKGVEISTNDKVTLLKSMSNKDMSNYSKELKSVLFDEIKVDGIVINSSDQIEFLSLMNGVDKNTQADILYKKIDKAPKSIRKVLEPKMNYKKIKKFALVLMVLYICSALFTYVESIIMAVISNKFAKKLRSMITNKINKLPLKYFDAHQAGDTLSRVTNDVDMIAQSMNQSLATLVSAITLFIGSTIMMFYTNWIMALTAILSSLFGFIFMAVVLSKDQKYFIARQNELGDLNGHIEEVYSGLNVVKAYNGEYDANKKFDKLNGNLFTANRMSQFLSGLMPPMMMFIGNFGYVSVCIVGALLTMNDVISFGVVVAFIIYVRLFSSPLSQIAQGLTSMQSTAAAGERVFEFLDEEEMIEEKQINKLKKSEVEGNIEFKNVTFTYDGNKKPTIKNFSAKCKKGSKIAIVGPTGAGKTTMVNLLMKFYDINSGDILIDGTSIKDLTRENIHELFTMVLQDTWLFEGTIKENIIYNRKNVTDKQVKDVCKTVGLDHFIKTLPKGYESSVANNDSVSAGQRQLLTIARGMLEDSPFLILDEATSNVDTRTEELVQKAMDKLSKGKTSFIIAHRLSTIKNADLILVMKDGNIVESGNHKQLMKKNGFYAELYNSQFEL